MSSSRVVLLIMLGGHRAVFPRINACAFTWYPEQWNGKFVTSSHCAFVPARKNSASVSKTLVPFFIFKKFLRLKLRKSTLRKGRGGSLVTNRCWVNSIAGKRRVCACRSCNYRSIAHLSVLKIVKRSSPGSQHLGQVRVISVEFRGNYTECVCRLPFPVTEEAYVVWLLKARVQEEAVGFR